MTNVSGSWRESCSCSCSSFGRGLFQYQGEPREAGVALSILQQDNWILPVNNGVDIPYKPLFLHWCIALLSLLTGGVTEYTARFPSALALAVMVLAGYVFSLAAGEAKWLLWRPC